MMQKPLPRVEDLEDSFTVTLRTPVQVEGEDRITEITVTEPTASQIEKVDKKRETSIAAGNTLLVSLVAGISLKAAGLIGISSINRAAKFMNDWQQADAADDFDPADIPDELVLTLRKPIVLQDRKIEEITLKEPTADQIEQVFKRAESSAAGSNILLVALSSGHAVGEIGKMGISDLNRGLKYLQVFISAGQETGRT